MTIASRLRWFLHWLLRDPALIWLAVLVPVLAIAAGADLTGPPERRVRVAGFLMTVFGVGLVGLGVLDTRRLFGQTPYRQRFIAWIEELPRIFGPGRVITATGGSSLGLSSHATATVRSTARNASISARLAALERNVKEIDTQVSALEHQLREESQKWRQELEGLSSHSRQETSKLAARLEAYSTGSVDLELMGAAWVLIGQAYGSFPQEIANNIRWLFPW